MADPLIDVRNIDVAVKLSVEQSGENTVEARLYCMTDNCFKDIDLYSAGRHTEQEVVCPVHGKVGFFPNHAAFLEFTRFVANATLKAGGHALLRDTARAVHVEDRAESNAVN